MTHLVANVEHTNGLLYAPMVAKAAHESGLDQVQWFEDGVVILLVQAGCSGLVGLPCWPLLAGRV